MMKYKMYKMAFQTAVHFGSGTLESGEMTFCADTLFSALCQEAYRQDASLLEQLYGTVRENQIRFSDAFPYVDDIYYLPKPMMRIDREQMAASSVLKKAYKKLKYIPADSFTEYLQGTYDVLRATEMNRLGFYEAKTAVSIRGLEESEPYRVGQFYFSDGAGLYFIVGYEQEEALGLVEELLEYLTYSGIGGKRAAGYGRFDLTVKKVPKVLEQRIQSEGAKYMSLSLCLPQEHELEAAMDGAEYTLCKRSGFVASETYAKEQMRKRDLYVLKAGACFTSKFEGDVYDVSTKGGGHAVYRYAKPLFMEVDV